MKKEKKGDFCAFHGATEVSLQGVQLHHTQLFVCFLQKRPFLAIKLWICLKIAQPTAGRSAASDGSGGNGFSGRGDAAVVVVLVAAVAKHVVTAAAANRGERRSSTSLLPSQSHSLPILV